MAGSTLSFRLCLLLALPTAVLLCSCIPKTTRELLCEADYVIRGEVTGVVDVVPPGETTAGLYSDKLLQVNVQEIYKSGQTFSWTNNVQIRTASHGSLCGWIPNNGVYIIAGRINNDGPSINNCAYARTWSTVSQEDKDLITEVSSDISCGGIPVTSPLPRKQQRKQQRRQQRKEARKQQRKESRKQQRKVARKQQRKESRKQQRRQSRRQAA